MLKRSYFLLILALTAIPSLLGNDYQLWKSGRQSWYDDDWASAVTSFQELIAKHPESRFRCKSAYYLAYSLFKLGKVQQSLETLNQLIQTSACTPETIDDAKAKRLQIAFELAPTDPSHRKVLQEGLLDPNIDIRLSAAVWLSELNDASGMGVFFEVLENEKDRDRKDTAIKHILKLGSEVDKARLNEILKKQKEESAGKPKMVRLIIRDLKTNEESIKINLPIGLFSVVIKSLSDEQIDLVKEQAGIDLRNFNLNLEDLPAGKILFEVTDRDQTQIKLFLE